MSVEAQSSAHQSSAARAADINFEPIQPLRAHEYVAEQIRRHIALRLIQPGESLPSERELTRMFGVGRPTIQHAMRLLEADHLIEARRGRGGGTFVSAPEDDTLVMEELLARLRRGRDELEDVLVYRRTLEPPATHLAASMRRRGDIASMRRAIRRMADAPSEQDYMRYETEFHLAIASATQNRFIEVAIEEIRMKLNDAMTLLPESDTWHGRLSGEHEAILEAIDIADPESAQAAMDVHVANSEQGIRAVLAAIRRRQWS